MKYRLVALDLDGTLLDSQLQIRPETVDVLKRIRAQGVRVMIVTGRHHVTAYPYWHQLALDTPAICCNGAYIYDFVARQPLTGNPLAREEARKLLSLCRAHAIDTMVYVGEFMAYEEETVHYANIRNWSRRQPEAVRPRIEQVDSFERLIEEASCIWKFLASGTDRMAMSTFAREAEDALGVSCEWSGEHRLDIARGGNSKGKRLGEWLASQGLNPEQVIAFGDQQNDMEMLHLAGLGVAMGNSGESVRACADWVAGCNDSGAIADVLDRFVPLSA